MSSFLDTRHHKKLGILMEYFILMLLHRGEYEVDLQDFVLVTFTSPVSKAVNQKQNMDNEELTATVVSVIIIIIVWC